MRKIFSAFFLPCLKPVLSWSKDASVAIFIIAVLVGFSNGDQHTKHSYTGNDYRVECHVLNGLYDGLYTSWHKNGKKKAEGNFKANMRVGKWTAWDSTGQMRMQREYKNSFEYKRTFPAYAEGPATLFAGEQWKLEYDEHGLVTYFYLNERAVSVSKRTWRFVPRKNNPALFDNDHFFVMLKTSTLEGSLFIYEDDEFRIKRAQEIVKSQSTAKKSFDDSLIGYRVKEDWFFDNDRMLSESRIIGICPVTLSGKDTVELGWYYYPQVRVLLGAEKLASPQIPAYIHSLDDLFFFRYFYGEIYKEGNIYNRALKEYASGPMLEQEQNRIAYSLIELEHDEWIRLGNW